MEKKQVLIIGASVIIFAGLVFAAIFYKGDTTQNAGVKSPQEINQTGQNAPGMDLLKTNPTSTSTPATYTAEVPKNATATVPVASAPAAPGSDASLGFYNLKIDSSGFHPNSITVKKGNIIRIEVTSVDGDYDMEIPQSGMYWAIKKGEMKPFMYTAEQAGTFLFKCRDFCPAGKVFQGTIITLDK
ncbi:MAG: cupredoxin domain-containing protein [Candidatus Jorgensenbacteria bacterium]|nr:cupredoxin domain-containing protein [Candidatus Jorgensenbacteria bacterium]